MATWAETWEFLNKPFVATAFAGLLATGLGGLIVTLEANHLQSVQQEHSQKSAVANAFYEAAYVPPIMIAESQLWTHSFKKEQVSSGSNSGQMAAGAGAVLALDAKEISVSRSALMSSWTKLQACELQVEFGGFSTVTRQAVRKYCADVNPFVSSNTPPNWDNKAQKQLQSDLVQAIKDLELEASGNSSPSPTAARDATPDADQGA